MSVSDELRRTRKARATHSNPAAGDTNGNGAAERGVQDGEGSQRSLNADLEDRLGESVDERWATDTIEGAWSGDRDGDGVEELVVVTDARGWMLELPSPP